MPTAGKVSNGVSLSKAQLAVEAAYDAATTLELSQQHYNEFWSETYDEDMRSISFAAPRELTRVVDNVANKLRLDRTNVRVLDVACGTGMFGEKLCELGFTNVDGLDASPKMLEKARSKQVYKKLCEAFINVDEPVAGIEPETYDMVTASGAFADAQVPAGGLRQLVKLVKHNTGLVALCHRVNAEHVNDEGNARFKRDMLQLQDSLVREGLVEIILEETIEKYVQYKNEWVSGRAVVLRRSR